MADSQASQVFMPVTLDEALRLKAKFGDEARFVAGGTDLLLQVKMGKHVPRAYIRLVCANQVSAMRDESVFISAFATLDSVIADPCVSSRLPLLVEALSRIGSPHVRNLATLGGNLGNASPAADSVPPLLVYSARVNLESIAGTREVPIEQFFVGPGKTVLDSNEVITGVTVPLPGSNELTYFNKFGPRGANVISSASFGARLIFDGQIVTTAFLAAGSVAPRPIRLPQTERALTGRNVSELAEPSTRRHLVDTLAREISPITDVRGSAWYKSTVIQQCLKRLLELTGAKQGGA